MKSKNEKEKELTQQEALKKNKRIINKIVSEIREGVHEGNLRLNPHPNRILCFEKPIGSIKTKSGLEQSANFQAGQKEGQTIELVRYFIVAMGNNVRAMDFNGIKAEVGDEFIHNLVQTAVRVEIPIVYDYAHLDDAGEFRKFVSFDISEIHAIIKHDKTIPNIEHQ